MRGLIEGAMNPLPLADRLPSLLQDDGFVPRMTAGFDAVLAPVLLTLDNVEAYFDLSTAPPDYVRWLGDWVGVALDESWPQNRRRTLVARAADLYRWRGTVRGLAELVALYAGVEPEIEESGGATWSETPDGALPGADDPALVVRVRVRDPGAVDARLLDRIVRQAKPAHVPHAVEVRGQ